jgi:hypothetical protein
MFGNSGSNGFLDSTYTAPEASGIWEMRVTGIGPAGEVIAPFESTIFIRVAGLRELLAGVNYNLIGQTAIHPDNHFGNTGFNNKLVRVANLYAAAFPGNKLNYNDISLRLGGIFDLSANWLPKHAWHRFGVDADLRSITIPQSHRNTLRKIIKNAGIRTLLEETEPPHWHLQE